MDRRRLLPPLAALALAACSGHDEETAGFSASAPTGVSVSASAGSGSGTSDGGSEGESSSDTTAGTTASTTASTSGGTFTTGSTTQPTTGPGTGSTTTDGTSTSSTGDPCMELTRCTTTDSTGGDDDPCAGEADGLYCGSALGGLADHNSLYQCMGGKTYSAQPCDLGCEDNLCKKPMSDPCAAANSGNGDYCGSTLPGGDAGSLYTCIDGKTTDMTPCSMGCQVNPPGVADQCNTADLCEFATSGDGAYCGSSLKPGEADGVLFQCKGKKTESQQTCANGCQQMPPGEPDVCKSDPNNNSCCVNKPPGSLTQSYTACGNGGSHYGIDLGTAIGTPIYAGIAGTVTSMALGYPNCYDMGCSQACWNAFNYVKVKSDCGDPNEPNKDFYVYYLHIDGVPNGIKTGVHVDQGQLLAYSGNSGCSSGPHIHIETVSVTKGGQASLSTCNSQNPAQHYCP
ncbi:MAG: M23 family metallopeptidase [Nannocystaceae bacterium]